MSFSGQVETRLLQHQDPIQGRGVPSPPSVPGGGSGPHGPTSWALKATRVQRPRKPRHSTWSQTYLLSTLFPKQGTQGQGWQMEEWGLHPNLQPSTRALIYSSVFASLTP